MTVRYEEWDAGACYACGCTWEPGEGERHRRGCYRIRHPVGIPPEGQCPECGCTPSADQLARGVSYATGPCPNEGRCSRWRDPGEFYDDEPTPHGELVAADSSRYHDPAPGQPRTPAPRVEDEDDLEDLPF